MKFKWLRRFSYILKCVENADFAPQIPYFSPDFTRNHTEIFRLTECGMPDLRRKTEGALFKGCPQNHTECDRNVCKSKNALNLIDISGKMWYNGYYGT